MRLDEHLDQLRHPRRKPRPPAPADALVLRYDQATQCHAPNLLVAAITHAAARATPLPSQLAVRLPPPLL